MSVRTSIVYRLYLESPCGGSELSSPSSTLQKSSTPDMHVEEMTLPIQEFLVKERLPRRFTGTLARLLAQDALKLLLVGEPKVLAGLATALKAAFLL
jgi:hypothetical protein